MCVPLKFFNECPNKSLLSKSYYFSDRYCEENGGVSLVYRHNDCFGGECKIQNEINYKHKNCDNVYCIPLSMHLRINHMNFNKKRSIEEVKEEKEEKEELIDHDHAKKHKK